MLQVAPPLFAAVLARDAHGDSGVVVAAAAAVVVAMVAAVRLTRTATAANDRRKGISKKFENVHDFSDGEDVTMEGNNTWDLSEFNEHGL